MPSNFNKFKYAFLGTVLLIATVLAAYQFFYAVPKKKCEAAGSWWSSQYRACAHPIPIYDITGRRLQHAPGAPAASASASPAAMTAPAASASASAASASAAGHP